MDKISEKLLMVIDDMVWANVNGTIYDKITRKMNTSIILVGHGMLCMRVSDPDARYHSNFIINGRLSDYTL